MPGGALSLGQILTNAWDPATGLLPEGVIPIPENITRDTTAKESVHMNFNDNLNASFKLWTEMSNGPASGETGGSMDRSNTASWEIKTLAGSMFLPSIAYVQKALTSGDVPTKTQWWKLRRRLYLVTGVRTAHGATMDTIESKSTEIHAKVDIDTTNQGVPMKSGGEGHLATSTSNTLAAKGMSDFVFAYRLNEVTWRGWISHKAYTGGETAAVDGGDEGSDSDEGSSELDGYTVEGIKDEDFDGGWEVPLDKHTMAEEVIYARK